MSSIQSFNTLPLSNADKNGGDNKLDYFELPLSPSDSPSSQSPVPYTPPTNYGQIQKNSSRNLGIATFSTIPASSSVLLVPRQSRLDPSPEPSMNRRVSEDILWSVYLELLQEQPAIEKEAIEGYRESIAYSDSNDLEGRPELEGTDALVNRRAPLNPLASPRLGKYRQKNSSRKPKVVDPALKNNPLRGKLIVLFMTTGILLFTFLQALCANKAKYKAFYAPKDLNKMFGPCPQILLDLGGLNMNNIRNKGELFRLFWAMWMHSGWIHIGLNILCQSQYLFMFEPDWGFRRVILIFWISGVTVFGVSGNLVSAIANPCSTTVGSSGALFGLMGAMVPYCIEFWKTIPRPACTLGFSVAVLIISLLTGFTSNTDNWAHMGGLLGGLCVGLSGIRTLAACAECCKRKARNDVPPEVSEDAALAGSGNRVKKKVLRRGPFMRTCKQRYFPKYRCGIREWITRVTAGATLIIVWAVCFNLMFSAYDYQPAGQVTYSGVKSCVCCYLPDTDEPTWHCDFAETPLNSKRTWSEYCESTFGKKGNQALKYEYQSQSIFGAAGFHGMSLKNLLATESLKENSNKYHPVNPLGYMLNTVASSSLPSTDSPVNDIMLHNLPDDSLIPNNNNNAVLTKYLAELVRISHYKNFVQDLLPRNFSQYFSERLTPADLQLLGSEEKRYQKRNQILRAFLYHYFLLYGSSLNSTLAFNEVQNPYINL